MAVPNRKTSEHELNVWNEALRASPGYINYMKSIGKPTDGRVKLSRSEQEGLERVLAQAGIPIPSGMHIDQGGNLNQKNTLVRNIAIGAGITAATLATAGAAGFGPLAGVMGGSAGAAGGAGAVGASMPAATGGIAAGTTFGGAAGAASMPGVIAGIPSGIGIGGATAIPSAGAAGASGAGGAGGFMRSLLDPGKLRTIGQGLGAISGTQAHNRGTALDAMMTGDKLQMDLDAERRDSEKDIMRKLYQTNYIKSGGVGANKGPSPISTNSGKPFTKFDFGVRESSDLEKEAATTLEQQLMERLKNPAKLSDYQSKMNPGAMESISNYLGPALTGLDLLKNGDRYQPPANAPTSWK